MRLLPPVTAVLLLPLVLASLGSGAAGAQPLAGAPGCRIFPPTSPWNQRVDSLPVASGSAAIVRAAGLSRLHADFSDSDADGYGIPVNVVGAGTPRSTVTFDYEDESDDVGYPIPAAPHIEGGGDRHLLMVDRDACHLFELFAAERSDGSWHAGSGATWNLSSLALRPLGWTSADAAGLPILPGLARAEELDAVGGIDHALRITLPVTQRAYLWPARHFASSVRAAAQAPMGLRIRIKARFDTSGFGPQAKAVLAAGKRYGFLVADNGSAGFVQGVPSPEWDDDDLHALQDVPAAAFEVVDTSRLPGTPTARRLWNARWSSPPNTSVRRVTAFNSRAGYVVATARRDGAVVARRRQYVRQGLVRVDLPRLAGATYSVSVGS